jgi:hypothetical protein
VPPPPPASDKIQPNPPRLCAAAAAGVCVYLSPPNGSTFLSFPVLSLRTNGLSGTEEGGGEVRRMAFVYTYITHTNPSHHSSWLFHTDRQSVSHVSLQSSYLFFFNACILRNYLSKPLTSLSCSLNVVFPCRPQDEGHLRLRYCKFLNSFFNLNCSA